MTYSLYRFRKRDKRYPRDYVQVHIELDKEWLVMGRKVSNSEIEMFDLEYIGERMTYARVKSEIERLSK